MKKIILMVLLLPSLSFASTLSYMVKNDGEIKSYLKLKNQNDEVFLKFSCNNFINDIKVSVEGLNEEDFYSKNHYKAKAMFKNQYQMTEWKVNYDDAGNFSLLLEKEGLQFANNLYQNGQLLLDMKELNGLKFFSTKHSYYLKSKMDLVFENCSIYF